MRGLRSACVAGSIAERMEYAAGHEENRLKGALFMSLASVQHFLSAAAPDIDVVIMEGSLATVELAAAALGIVPAQVAKTLTVTVGEDVMIVVMRGDARLDSGKFKRRFGAKPRFVPADTVEQVTGHPPGGVAPIGLIAPLPVFFDITLREMPRIFPAAGVGNAAFGIAPDRLAALTNAEWVDVSKYDDVA